MTEIYLLALYDFGWVKVSYKAVQRDTDLAESRMWWFACDRWAEHDVYIDIHK